MIVVDTITTHVYSYIHFQSYGINLVKAQSFLQRMHWHTIYKIIKSTLTSYSFEKDKCAVLRFKKSIGLTYSMDGKALECVTEQNY